MAKRIHETNSYKGRGKTTTKPEEKQLVCHLSIPSTLDQLGEKDDREIFRIQTYGPVQAGDSCWDIANRVEICSSQ